MGATASVEVVRSVPLVSERWLLEDEGATELWVFDPMRVDPSHRGPFTHHVWRRDRHGRFVQTNAGDGPAYSAALSAWLVVTDEGTRSRVADDEEGTSLWPTPEEAALAREREALDEVARLRAEIERSRGG